MALGATMYRFQIELSDVGRGVYESLDLRVAQHPSENDRRMLARVLGYALQYDEGIEFGRGVSTAEDPTIWVKDLRGDLKSWIEVGQPSADRLHRASKLGALTVVYTYADPSMLLRELERAVIHRREEIEIWELLRELLDALESGLGRHERWSLTVNDGTLYVTRGDTTLEGELVRHALG